MNRRVEVGGSSLRVGIDLVLLLVQRAGSRSGPDDRRCRDAARLFLPELAP